ncbi:MAG: hypothetical protein RKR04_01580, partial [Candidatus Accumulibacter sp.]|nr:hypothetical protein [Accumulibacter sp.]
PPVRAWKTSGHGVESPIHSIGYEVRVTELSGWEHALKNELIVAVDKDLPTRQPARRFGRSAHALRPRRTERAFRLAAARAGCRRQPKNSLKPANLRAVRLRADKMQVLDSGG